jgi:hypothetical protein
VIRATSIKITKKIPNQMGSTPSDMTVGYRTGTIAFYSLTPTDSGGLKANDKW